LRSTVKKKEIIMGKALDFGVQSYCFRASKKNGDVAAKVREIGLNQVELCGVHADFHHPAAFKDVVKIYRDAGVAIVSFGVETFVGDEKEREVFECAAIAGAKHIAVHFKVDSFPEAIARTQKLSDEFGVRVGIHCHGGYQFGGQPDVLDHLIKLGSPQIGLCLDTAWCLQIGPHLGRPVEWAKRYAGHIYGLHYKDFVFDKNAQWIDTVVGQGNLDLPAFIQALDSHGFDGVAVIEYEGDVQNPVPALNNCVKAMRNSGKP
jgi:sugar phosphate isomerase/epimerase